MSYRLEAAVAEGGRQSKGCYRRFLGLLNRVYLGGSDPAGRRALSTCSVLLTPYFPVYRESWHTVPWIKYTERIWKRWPTANYLEIYDLNMLGIALFTNSQWLHKHYKKFWECKYIFIGPTGAEWSKLTKLCVHGQLESLRSSNLDVGKAVNSVCNHHSNIYDSYHCLFSIYLTPVTPASRSVNSSIDISKQPQTAASYTLSPADELATRTQIGSEIWESLKTLTSLSDSLAYIWRGGTDPRITTEKKP